MTAKSHINDVRLAVRERAFKWADRWNIWRGILRDSGCTALLQHLFRRRTRRGLDDFDARYNVRTTGRTDRRALGLPPSAVSYFPSDVEELAAVVRSLPLKLDEVAFADIGAGKGRVMLAAAQLPFRRVIGIEMAPALAAAAERNFESYRGPRAAGSLNLAVADAAEWDPPNDCSVFYLYNPFGAAVLAKFLENVVASYNRAPRPIYCLYLNPVHANVFDEFGFVRSVPSSATLLLFELNPALTGVPGSRAATTIP